MWEGMVGVIGKWMVGNGHESPSGSPRPIGKRWVRGWRLILSFRPVDVITGNEYFQSGARFDLLAGRHCLRRGLDRLAIYKALEEHGYSLGALLGFYWPRCLFNVAQRSLCEKPGGAC